MALYHFDKTTRLNETKIYKNAVSQSNFYRSEKEHRTGKIDDFNELATLFERLDKSRRVSFD